MKAKKYIVVMYHLVFNIEYIYGDENKSLFNDKNRTILCMIYIIYFYIGGISMATI